MKKVSVFLFLFFTFSNIAYTQSVSCYELTQFVVENGYRKGSLSSYTLNSSWLTEVTAYSYDNSIFVVAKIKRNEYSYTSETYVFCGISNSNWNSFYYGGYGISTSYGERFHKYIIDYQCNCN